MSTKTLENPSRRQLFSRTPSELARLPWVLSHDIFIDKCTQCAKCIDSCETNIITKDKKGYPQIDFVHDECTFCEKCIDVCAEPLFIEKEQRSEQPAWPGSINIAPSCFALNNIHCQSCRDACEPQAIKFSYMQDSNSDNPISSIPRPTLTESDCTQCGACISSCPQNAISLSLSNNLPNKQKNNPKVNYACI